MLTKKEQRRKKQLEAIHREIQFQKKHFSFDAKKSTFYIEGIDTKTWFSVENTVDEPDFSHLSEIQVKNFNTFITAGIALSLEEKVSLVKAIEIIHQSLYVPLPVATMFRFINMQDRFVPESWFNFSSDTLFLGSKLTVVKASGWRSKSSFVQQKVGEVYYPVLHFRPYARVKGARSFKGLWLPDVMRADKCISGFATAVIPNTS